MPADLVVLQTERAACLLSVIETLEAALAEAKAGNIVAVALSVVRPSGAINTSRSQTDDVARLLGAVGLTHARLVKAIDE